MKLFTLVLVFVAFIASCDRKPFVEHKLKFEKVSGDCSGRSAAISLTSNFGGERYEFQKCLAEDFSKDQMTAERKGDSVLVRFPQPGDKPKALFALTLDIDSYPKYNFIVIDDETLQIGSKE